jgi:hypothetical protein
VAPITTAAIASSSKPTRAVGCPLIKRVVNSIAGNVEETSYRSDTVASLFSPVSESEHIPRDVF